MSTRYLQEFGFHGLGRQADTGGGTAAYINMMSENKSDYSGPFSNANNPTYLNNRDAVPQDSYALTGAPDRNQVRNKPVDVFNQYIKSDEGALQSSESNFMARQAQERFTGGPAPVSQYTGQIGREPQFVRQPYKKFAYPQDVLYPERSIRRDFARTRDARTTKGNDWAEESEVYWYRHTRPPNYYEMWDYNKVLHDIYLRDKEYQDYLNAQFLANAVPVLTTPPAIYRQTSMRYPTIKHPGPNPGRYTPRPAYYTK